MKKKDWIANIIQDEQRYEDKHIKSYVVVQPDLIDPDMVLGIQEPIVDNDVRDLVNVNDPDDRILANPDDFNVVGEIVTEHDFRLEEANYVDEQGVGTAFFAFRN
jgi:hypothetical protein